MAREIRTQLDRADEAQIEAFERELEGTQAEESSQRSDPYRASGAKHGAEM
jgi:hypothetical protein